METAHCIPIPRQQYLDHARSVLMVQDHLEVMMVLLHSMCTALHRILLRMHGCMMVQDHLAVMMVPLHSVCTALH